MKIGFIGLGIMGKPMSKNLLKAGYELMVSDHHQENVKEVEAAGAKAATNREIAENCDVIITMIPNSPHVKSVMLGEEGMAAFMREGQIFVEGCSADVRSGSTVRTQVHLPLIQKS